MWLTWTSRTAWRDKEVPQVGGLRQDSRHAALDGVGLAVGQALHRRGQALGRQVLDHAARALAALVQVVVEKPQEEKLQVRGLLSRVGPARSATRG